MVQRPAPIGGIKAIIASETRSDLFGLIERVNLDQAEVEITSKRGSAVLMSKDKYDSLLETTSLLRFPKNARRLNDAIESTLGRYHRTRPDQRVTASLHGPPPRFLHKQGQNRRTLKRINLPIEDMLRYDLFEGVGSRNRSNTCWLRRGRDASMKRIGLCTWSMTLV
ncbi:prevent-host-death family protein [Leifsonia shinshuensis]|nr:prevent-host-death family protein [Leifsonia shinshuensis]